MGVNTESPKSTLDVQANPTANYPDGIIPPRITADALKAKEAAYGVDQNGAIVYVTNPLTSTVGAIKTAGITSEGTYIYQANTLNIGNANGLWVKLGTVTPIVPTNTDVYTLKAAGNLGLINLGLNPLGVEFSTIPLRTTDSGAFDVGITSPNVTYSSATGDGYYTIPSTGLYHINYAFRMGQGLTLDVLSGASPATVITVASSHNATQSVLDSRTFGGVSLTLSIGLANLTLAQSQISHVYELQAGQVIRFGLIRGGIGINLLADASTEISIYKLR